jgi:hypothetical protein
VSRAGPTSSGEDVTDSHQRAVGLGFPKNDRWLPTRAAAHPSGVPWHPIRLRTAARAGQRAVRIRIRAADTAPERPWRRLQFVARRDVCAGTALSGRSPTFRVLERPAHVTGTCRMLFMGFSSGRTFERGRSVGVQRDEETTNRGRWRCDFLTPLTVAGFRSGPYHAGPSKPATS